MLRNSKLVLVFQKSIGKKKRGSGIAQHTSSSVQDIQGGRVASSSINTLSFCNHYKTMVKKFQKFE